jgi:hypothetical protein
MMLRLGAYDPNEEMLDVYYSSGYYSSGADVTDPNEEMLNSYYSSGAGVTNPYTVPSGGSFNTILIPGVNTIQIPGTVQPQQQPQQPQQQPQQQPPADSGTVYRVATTGKMPPGLPWGLLILGAVALVMLVRNN